MSTSMDENGFKQCLQGLIATTNETINQFQEYDDNDSTDNSPQDSSSTYYTHTFTLDKQEDEMIDKLKIKTESMIKEQLPLLSSTCQKYLLNLLYEYEYDEEKHQFKNSLNLRSIIIFSRDLQGALASIDGFKGAWNGDLSIVKDLTKKFPKLKDKPGLWGTTLLYSASKNNHLKIVKYLIETVQCSVNAPNLRDFEKSFLTLTTKPEESSSPQIHLKSSSTALHGACKNGHLKIVKYLIEHDANYFLKNENDETPIMNGEFHGHIREFFQEYLLLGYSNISLKFPTKTILDETELIIDGLWEYKPFRDDRWYSFSSDEAKQLQKSLIIKSDEQFQNEIRLKVHRGIYCVSIIEFLRSGKDEDKTNNLAWVRCRGSSILNFDCYSVWQMMFLKYPNVKAKPTPSLKISKIPLVYDSQFQIELNCWYTCDENTNSQLDQAMNFRKKINYFKIDFISDENILFNLQTFQFENEQKTIGGFLRWIPKIISNNEQDKHTINFIDNFAALTNLNPIPLTRKRLQQITDANERDALIDEQIIDNDSTALQHDNDDDQLLDDFNQTTKSSDSGIYSINDMNSVDDDSCINTVTNNDIPHENPFDKPNDESNDTKDVKIDDYLDPDKDHLLPRTEPQMKEKTNSSDTDAISQSILDDLQKKKDEIINGRKIEKEKVERRTNSSKKQSDNDLQILANVLSRVDELNDELSKINEKEKQIKEIQNRIKTIEYKRIEKDLLYDILLPKSRLILDSLKQKSKELNHYFMDRIPHMTFHEHNNQYTITMSALEVHHQTFKEYLQNLITLSTIKQRAIEFYQRELNRTVKSINKILFQVRPTTKSWKQYSQFLYKLLKEKAFQYLILFKDYIQQKTIELCELIILDESISLWIEIRKATDSFIEQNIFRNDIHQLKSRALELFIEQNISFQKIKLDKKPTDKSLQTIEYFIKKIKQSFITDKIYTGLELKHFSLIPQLLQRLIIYYSCFTIQLPLFESAKKLLNIIENNTVITIATSTGSGKSTLLPCLLIAEGYDRVLVTQPRRLPCKLISEHVNETMITNSPKENLAGWSVSGESENSKAQILYLSDGLLKERLLNEKNFLRKQIQVNKSLIFFIDEVHERSINIDLCLALIARILTAKVQLRTKIKVIISSATLDPAVAQLFREIPRINFGEFTIPTMSTRYPIRKYHRPNENIINIVQELYRKLQRHDQILCFVNSTAEVNQCCKLLSDLSQGSIKAYPLIQSQSSIVQQSYIENGSVFFSTTVAETSLTFPSLKYVVDTGIINIPIYDMTCQRTILTEFHAAESTIKQRMGRLGRTKPGEYYALYSFDPKRKPFPTPQICQSDLISIEFSLRKSILNNGLNYLKQYLPNKPKREAIEFTVGELTEMGILRSNSDNHLTNYGKALAKLPEFGSLSMSICVLAALQKYHCGYDLICLASILSVLNTTSILTKLSNNFKKSEGDFMVLFDIMDQILSAKKSTPLRQFDLRRVCQDKGLTDIQHIIKQAVSRYDNFKNFFEYPNEFHEQSQMKCGKWEFIAKSLLSGYSKNIFVSMKELQEKTHHFMRYEDETHIAVLDSKSTLARSKKESPVSIVLARDIVYLTAIRSTAIISFLGEVKLEWLTHHVERRIKLEIEEENYLIKKNIFEKAKTIFSKDISMNIDNQLIYLKGPTAVVLKAELHFLQELIIEKKFYLDNNNPKNTTNYENLSRNLISVTKMPHIFRTMIWRWEAQKQVKITINPNISSETCQIIIKGRYAHIAKVEAEFDSFLYWLQKCVVIRHPNAGVSPRLVCPQMRDQCKEIEKRIARVTDPERTSVDLYNNVKGREATRETRMEVVAWISICKHNCKLEGGFVRDWIVGKTIQRPEHLLNNPHDWFDYETNNKNERIPRMNPQVVPSDLDFHLPTHFGFDIDQFQDELYKLGIECTVYRQSWRYVLLIDEYSPTGPFTIDFIEPHITLTYDRIDSDVSNFFLERNYTRDIGMRIDIQQKPYSIKLEIILDNIKNKSFQILRPIDKYLTDRINKMIHIRGWTQLGEPFSIIPEPHRHSYSLLVPLHYTSVLYQDLAQKMKSINTSLRIISIEEVKNPFLEDAYEAMKNIIAKQCTGFNPNERELFHGTKDAAIKGITEDGYDDRYFDKNGAWGHGAYFADDPKKSHNYTALDPNEHTHVMFYNKVLLGNQQVLQDIDQTLVSAPVGYHSIKGTKFQYTEYIIYRYGQALPYLKIIYKP